MNKLVVILVACLAITAAVQAERIQIDAGLTASGTGWNNPDFSDVNCWTVTGWTYYAQSGAVVDSTGATVAGAALGWSCIGDIRADGGSSMAGYPDSAATDIIQSVDSSQGDGSAPTANASIVVVSGLSGSAYDISLYSNRSSSGNRCGYLAVNTQTPVFHNADGSQSLVTFSGVAPATVTVAGTELQNAIAVYVWGEAASSGCLALNLVDMVAVPEPATMGLLAIGALMALRRRR